MSLSQMTECKTQMQTKQKICLKYPHDIYLTYTVLEYACEVCNEHDVNRLELIQPVAVRIVTGQFISLESWSFFKLDE